MALAERRWSLETVSGQHPEHLRGGGAMNVFARGKGL